MKKALSLTLVLLMCLSAVFATPAVSADTTYNTSNAIRIEWLTMEADEGGLTYEASQQTNPRWMGTDENMQGNSAFATTITGSQFFFFLHPDSIANWNDIDVSQAKYIAFDLYVSKDINTANILDAGINVGVGSTSWDGGGAVTNAFASTLKATPTLTKGWHHFTLPLVWSNSSFDTTAVRRGRIYLVNNSSLSGLEVGIDDVVYLTEAGKTDNDKRNAAKDATIAIRAIPDVNSLTLNDQATVAAAADALAAVESDYREYILADTSIVSSAQTKINQLIAAENAPSDAVIAQIAALNVTSVNDKAAVQAARRAYEALTATQKQRVTNLSKLETAEAKIAELETAANQKAADAVIAKIAALNVTSLNDKQSVVSARSSYTLLNNDQKALVTNLAKLEAAEAEIVRLENEANQAAADVVIAKINALPTDVTLEDKAAVEAARAAYNALTDAQKALVTNLAKLERAEAALHIVEPVDVQFRAFDNTIDDVAGDAISKPDTYVADSLESVDHIEGSAALKFTQIQAGYGNYFTYIYHHQQDWNTDKTADGCWRVPVSEDGMYVTFDMYCSDWSVFQTATGDVGFNVDALQPNTWGDTANANGAVLKTAFAGAPDEGWIHVALPLSFIRSVGNEMTVYDIRFYACGISVPADTVVMFDDMRFMNAKAVATILPGRSAAKDVTIAIRQLTDDSTFAENKAIVDSYEALADEYKALVMDYDEFYDVYTEKFADEIAGSGNVDQVAADAVIAKINALNVTSLNDKAAVEAARAAYTALTADQKALVTNLAKLESAEAKIAELQATADKEAADKAAADAVIAKINALNVTSLNDKTAVDSARAAYTALTADQKALVNNLAKLESAEAKIAELQATADKEAADKAAADAVIAKINALNVTSLNDKTAVDSARAAYTALTADQKALVNNLAKLESAEAKIAELQAAADKEAADKAAADAVIAQINALNVTSLNDKAAVEAARAAYTALTADQQALVSNLAKLEAAEAKIAELEKEPEEELKNGPVDGYFYENGVMLTAYQVVEYEGNYYFITDGNKLAVNATLYLTEAFIGDCDLAVGYYTFDANGVMAPYTGIIGDKFYRDGELVKAYQVVEYNGNYYFVSDAHKLAKNAVIYMGAQFLKNTGMPEGYYSFDAEGVMRPYTGIIMGRFYYKDAVMVKAYKVIEHEGYYYFIYDGNCFATDCALFVSAQFLTGTNLTPGYYTFDSKGRLSGTVTGLYDGKYFIDGVQQNAYQVVSYGGNYYFISDGNRLAVNTTMYLTDKFVGSFGLKADYYCFDANGVMTPQLGIMNGKFYRNGVLQKAYQVVEYNGDYYFISDNNKLATNTTMYLSAKFVEGTPLTEGYYSFDADGKIIR